MVDDKGGDDKIVAVCIDDPSYAQYTKLEELPPHIMKELDRFFRDYKTLEEKLVEVDRFYDRERALAIISESRAAYDRGEGR
jgi:inorganic pyrophosphatase